MAMIESITAQDLVVAWQGAKTHEGLNDQSIFWSRSADAGATWSDVQVLVSGGQYAPWGPVFHWDGNALWLFYAQSGAFDQDAKEPGRSSVGGDICTITSHDHGVTWSAPRVILPFASKDGKTPKVTANKLVVGANGRWILPIWQTPNGVNSTGAQAAGVLLSDDAGATWRANMIWNASTKLIENSIGIAAKNGTLVMLFRTGEGVLYRSYGSPDGETWSPPAPSEVPNPNSKAFVFTDHDGRLVLACNPVKKRPRNPLVLEISTDGGATFAEYVNLDPGERTLDLEYPTAVEIDVAEEEEEGSATSRFARRRRRKKTTKRAILTVFSADHYTGIKLSRTAAYEAVNYDS